MLIEYQADVGEIVLDLENGLPSLVMKVDRLVVEYYRPVGILRFELIQEEAELEFSPVNGGARSAALSPLGIGRWRVVFVGGGGIS